jgi:hypothetical protein
MIQKKEIKVEINVLKVLGLEKKDIHNSNASKKAF